MPRTWACRQRRVAAGTIAATAVGGTTTACTATTATAGASDQGRLRGDHRCSRLGGVGGAWAKVAVAGRQEAWQASVSGGAHAAVEPVCRLSGACRVKVEGRVWFVCRRLHAERRGECGVVCLLRDRSTATLFVGVLMRPSIGCARRHLCARRAAVVVVSHRAVTRGGCGVACGAMS